MANNLEDRIREASQAYYDGQPIISDDEFDDLVEQLRKIDPENELLKKSGTGYIPFPPDDVVYGDTDSMLVPIDTQVGKNLSDFQNGLLDANHLRKYNHKIHAGSLDKMKHSESKKFTDDPFIVSLKLDGGSAVAYYTNGNLDIVLSRGDGNVGLNITKNIVAGGSIPTKLLLNKTIAVRGEILLTYEDFDKIGGTHPRNRAVGLSQSIHVSEDEVKYLKFFAYDIPLVNDNRVGTMEMYDKFITMRLLDALGFLVSPYEFYDDWDEFLKFIEQGWVGIQKENTEFEGAHLPVDGLVISEIKPIDDPNINEYRSIAYKFESEVAKTVVKDIEWNISRTGRLVPVLVVREVHISGANISRVTANNVNWISEMGCGKGSKIEVTRSNEVIPMVTRVIDPVNPIIPTICPECNTELIKDHRDLLCPNPVCSSKIDSTLKRILYMFAPDGLGDSSIDQLFQIFHIKDLDSLKNFIKQTSRSQIGKYFGPSTTDKLSEMVLHVEHRDLTIRDVMYVSNIPRVGHTSSKKLGDNVSIEDFRDAIGSLKVPDKWRNYVSTGPGFENLRNNWGKIVDVVRFYGIERIVKEDPAIQYSDVKVTVCITGKLSKPRKQLYEEFKTFGVDEASIKSCDILVCNEKSTSNKYRTAEKRGIPIMSEQEFRGNYIEVVE